MGKQNLKSFATANNVNVPIKITIAISNNLTCFQSITFNSILILSLTLHYKIDILFYFLAEQT